MTSSFITLFFFIYTQVSQVRELIEVKEVIMCHQLDKTIHHE